MCLLYQFPSNVNGASYIVYQKKKNRTEAIVIFLCVPPFNLGL